MKVDPIESLFPEAFQDLPSAGVGQVHTPEGLAEYVAGWLEFKGNGEFSVLDPGAGHGALSEALLKALPATAAQQTSLTMVELDPVLGSHLQGDWPNWAGTKPGHVKVLVEDFLNYAPEPDERFTHILMNPPYARMDRSRSSVLWMTRGVRVVNTYAGFLWISADLLAPGGELVAIVPRSFCNGTQFGALRRHLFRNVQVKRIHAFRSRNAVFKRDRVLQEVIVILLRKGDAEPASVDVSWSEGPDLTAIESASFDSQTIVEPNDPDKIIRIPIGLAPRPSRDEWPLLLPPGLLSVSTGTVVDFRTPEVSEQAGEFRVPLVDARSPMLRGNPAIQRQRYLRVSANTARHVFPPGDYVVVKRMSPKEQTPRLKVSVISKDDPACQQGIAFENHVNVIHANGEGLPTGLASMIEAALAHDDVENQFLEISGSTQVNVSDLLHLRLPLDDRFASYLGLLAGL